MHPQTIIDYVNFSSKERRKDLARLVRGSFTEKPLAKYKDTEIWGHGWEFDDDATWWSIVYKGRTIYSSELFDDLSNPDNYELDRDSNEIEEQLGEVLGWFTDLHMYTRYVESW